MFRYFGSLLQMNQPVIVYSNLSLKSTGRLKWVGQKYPVLVDLSEWST